MKKKELGIILFGIILFLIISLIYKPITSFEHNIIRSVQAFMSILPNSIPIFLADFGYFFLPMFIPIASMIILAINKKYKTALVFGILILCVKHISEFLKILFNRPRPPHELWLVHVESTSYPSGHSFVNACVFSFLTYIVLKYIKNKPLKIALACCSILWILIIGFSRIWAGVHHPTDILSGYTAGFLCAYIFMIIDRKLTSS